MQQEKAGNTGRFYIEENNATIAELDYQVKDKTLIILHTEVDENLEGRGVGKELVAAAVDYVRNNALRINATCPYAKKVLDRTKEFADVYNPEKK
ncbi:MAG TPA: GNAT family N-acetyltransferase [Chitinophagaceae bacterium]|nr:GNAT family N-acetyltransferase [Chitinophagaceae bacterium]